MSETRCVVTRYRVLNLIFFRKLFDASFQVLLFDKVISPVEVWNDHLTYSLGTKWHIKHVFEADCFFISNHSVGNEVGSASDNNRNHMLELDVEDVIRGH